MKKNSSVQGTFSRLFGKKHGNSGNSSTTSLYVTNPPWVFTQEVSSDKPKSSGDIDGIYYGDNRFGSVTDSGTATLKARPRVRPLLTFLPLNAQEGHGVAVPTPSVPEGFEENASLGSQINGGYRKYNSVLDLRSKAYEEGYFNDEDIPPPPSVPPPPPPSSTDIPSSPPPLVEAPPPPPLMEAPPPPPLMEAPPPPPPLEEAPPPPPMMPPPPPPPSTKPVVSPSFLAPSSYPQSNVSSPSTPTPPDFIPPPPPLAFMDDASPPVSPPPPPLAFQTPPFSNGVSKWKSETVLNLRQSDNSSHNLNHTSPPTPNQESQLPRSSPDPHLTFPRSLKVPPPTPVRTSSIPSGEKESSPQEEQLPKMVPHSRPALPPSFTIQTATVVHSKGEAGEKVALEKTSTLITDNSKLTLDSNSSSTSSLKGEVPVAEDTKFPTPDSASSDDDDWKERTNLDKLKHELSALLSSSCRKDDRQSERTVVPKTKTSITDGNQGSTDELKPVKPAVTGPQLPTGTETERKEKIGTHALSPGKAFSGDALSAADSKSTIMPTDPVMKFKNELEAVLSPAKDGGPPLALANLRHNPETKKQVTLQFGGSQSRLPKPPANQNPATPEVTKKLPESPSASFIKSPSGNHSKLPDSPLKQKNEPLAPAVPSPFSSGTASPVRTASPNIDFSLLQYKTHRTRFGSVDSMGSGTSSQTLEDGSISTNNGESQRDSAESMSSQTPGLSRNTEQTNNHALIHPITGETVEKGSPMALLLAAQQRAQKGRCSSATTSRQNSYLSEKSPLMLSEKLQNSSQSETRSSSSTIYYSDSKPNTVTVVPKSPQRASHAVLENKQPNGSGISDSKIWGTPGVGQREHKPYSFSSASEQCRNVQQLRENESQNPPTPNKSSASVFEQALTEPSHLKQQGPHSTPEASLSLFNVPQSHTQSKNDEADMGFKYEIIPPPPEFSNNASGVTDGFSNGQDNYKDSNLRRDDRTFDRWPAYNHSSYSYNNSYSLTSKSVLESSIKPSGYNHHYPGGTYSASYLNSYSNSRPLIKKRLYVSESDRSYGRSPTMTSRSMSTPTTYGHSTMAYNSQVAEGMRRMNPGHRNVPNSAQGRRVSLELPGKMMSYNNAAGDSKYKGQNGEYPTSAAPTSRPSHGSQQYGGTANTFTVRPGTRQPISYSHQGGLR